MRSATCSPSDTGPVDRYREAGITPAAGREVARRVVAEGGWPGVNDRVRRGWRHRLHARLVATVELGVEAVLARRLAWQREYFDHRLDALAGQLRGEIGALRAELHALEVRDRRDMLAAGERAAVASSAAFVAEHMPGARTFPAPEATLQYALSLAPRGGMALEFGVYSGATLTQIAEDRGGVEVYGFDSFAGLPEHWRAGFSRGTFVLDTVPEVAGAALVIGWFAETLPGFLTEHPGPVDLLHVDADLYSSTVTVLEHVGPRLRAGSVVVFDEYLNHPGWQHGEHRAWSEYVAAYGLRFRYEALTHDHEQVVVVVETPATTAHDGS